LGGETLRKCTGVEDCAVLPGRATRPNQEDYILAALHGGFDPGKIFFAVHWLFVDFQDHVSAGEGHILGERTRLHVLHDHTLTGRHVEALRYFRSEFADSDAELARLGFPFVIIPLLVP